MVRQNHGAPHGIYVNGASSLLGHRLGTPFPFSDLFLEAILFGVVIGLHKCDCSILFRHFICEQKYVGVWTKPGFLGMRSLVPNAVWSQLGISVLITPQR